MIIAKMTVSGLASLFFFCIGLLRIEQGQFFWGVLFFLVSLVNFHIFRLFLSGKYK